MQSECNEKHDATILKPAVLCKFLEPSEFSRSLQIKHIFNKTRFYHSRVISDYAPILPFRQWVPFPSDRLNLYRA